MTALNPTAQACADVRKWQNTRLLDKQRDALDGAIESVTLAIDWLSRGRTADAAAILQKNRELLRALRRSL